MGVCLVMGVCVLKGIPIGLGVGKLMIQRVHQPDQLGIVLGEAALHLCQDAPVVHRGVHTDHLCSEDADPVAECIVALAPEVRAPLGTASEPRSMSITGRVSMGGG